VFEATFSRTERRATIDSPDADPVAFAAETLGWAQDHEFNRVIWHFYAQKSLDIFRYEPTLAPIARELKKIGSVVISGVEIVLATARSQPVRGSDKTPTAAWWPDDNQLLAIDSTHLPLLNAYVSSRTRAPIWLTAFDLDCDDVDPFDSSTSSRHDVSPIEVSGELQEMVVSRSGMMTLSTNGVYDSCAAPLVKDCRRMVRDGSATPEAIGVAALRAGWWPRHIPDLIKKVAV
jgi:hypothetical protein